MKDVGMKKKRIIEVGDKVHVGLFSGKVVRTREFQGETWYDVEISGVINPYRMHELEICEFEPE